MNRATETKISTFLQENDAKTEINNDSFSYIFKHKKKIHFLRKKCLGFQLLLLACFGSQIEQTNVLDSFNFLMHIKWL